MNIEGATFILRTADLTTDSIGTVNNIYSSSFTWKSIDIKSILGTMWNDYDYFNIALVANAANVLSNAGTFTALSDQKLGTIYMSGLNWINASYDTKTKTIKPEAPIGFINFSSVSTTVGSLIQYNGLNVSSFSKSSPITDITISYRSIVTDTVSTSAAGTTFPAQSFMFEIIPIKKDNISFNSKRINV
jgi:hypothetical protein